MTLVQERERESEVARPCPTLHDPRDCSPPGSAVHGILQARVLEWVSPAIKLFKLSENHHVSQREHLREDSGKSHMNTFFTYKEEI